MLAVIPSTGTWTATTNAPWLHLNPTNQSGTGSTNVIFYYDANPGPTRSGSLTIAGQTLTVTQAGSTYVAAGQVTTLVSSGLNQPGGVAVDSAGNVYFSNFGSNTIQEWTVANNTVTTLVSGLNGPSGVAVDSTGNVYIADRNNNAIKEWSVTGNTVTTLVSSGLFDPCGVAVDGAGNVYIADSLNEAIKEWTVANNTVTSLVSGLREPFGVALDVAGNVYIGDGPPPTQYGFIYEWTAANSNLTTLVRSIIYQPGQPPGPLYHPAGVVADTAGNVYFADEGNNVIEEWTAANSNVTALVASGLNSPVGVAVDGLRNVYIADTGNNAIEELPYAFVDPTAKLESVNGGNDALPAVLPATENLLAPFAPTSDQSWLTITGITNDVISFSFTTNAGSARTAHITVLGQSIPITQQGMIGTPPTLTSVQMMGNGVIQFAFTNTPGASFAVLSTTNISLPLTNWTVAGTCTNTASNLFQFTSQPTTNNPRLFYTIRSP